MEVGPTDQRIRHAKRGIRLGLRFELTGIGEAEGFERIRCFDHCGGIEVQIELRAEMNWTRLENAPGNNKLSPSRARHGGNRLGEGVGVYRDAVADRSEVG